MKKARQLPGFFVESFVYFQRKPSNDVVSVEHSYVWVIGMRPTEATVRGIFSFSFPNGCQVS